MSDIFTVGKFKLPCCTKVQDYLNVVGTDIKMPITIINGAKPGKTVLITGGTHGGEYPGVETSIRIAAALKPEQVSGRVVIIHPVNVVAFFAKSQYINPLDGKNLNRVFPGSATGTVSERIAYTVSQIMAQSDFYMDLHGGDIHENLTPFVIYPSIGSEQVQKISFEASALLGIKYLIQSASQTGTYGAAATMGVPGFLAEIGACGRWSEQEVKTYVEGVLNVLKYLEVIEGEVKNLSGTVVLKAMEGLNSDVTGLWYPDVSLGDTVKVGDKLGVMKDCFGNVLKQYTSSVDGIIIYVITSLAINENDPLLAIGVI